MLTKPIEYNIPITPDTAVKMALNLSTKTIYYVDDNGIIQIVGSVASNNGVFNNVTITGGTIQGVALTLDSLDNTPIGSNTPSTGRFTTLTTTGLASFNSMSTANATITGGTIQGVAMTLDSLDNTPIGATTPSTGKFTILSANSVTSVTPVLSFNGSNTIAAFGSTTANSYNQLIIQNKSGTSGASANYVISNDIGTDSTYYGEFGMNSSVFSASTPNDFFSINNGVYFSGHDGDLTYGSGNGFKSYFAWGATANSAHVINASGALGLSTNLGTTPALSGTTGFGTAGQVMISNGSGAANSWSSTPTLVGTNFTSIPNGALTNSSITFGSTAVALGATVSGFNGVNIGATTAGTGAFTTLSASSTVSGAGFSTYLASPPAIGGTAANTINGTTITASVQFSGPLNGTVGATTPNTGAFTSITNSGLVSGRVVYTTTGGLETSSASFLYDGNALTAGNFVPSSATVPTYGMYLPITNAIGFTTASTERMRIDASGNVLVTGAGGLGYGTGSGGAVTQITSRTTGVTLNKTNGAITLFTATGALSATTFTVTNSTVAATDVIHVCQKSGTNLYSILVTAVAAGSFNITFYTTGGVASDAPVFNFAVIKAVTA
jgi:hypothetical protein